MKPQSKPSMIWTSTSNDAHDETYNSDTLQSAVFLNAMRNAGATNKAKSPFGGFYFGGV